MELLALGIYPRFRRDARRKRRLQGANLRIVRRDELLPSCSTGLKTMPFAWVTSGPAKNQR